MKTGVRQALKNLDAFPRAEEHLLQKTRSGALGISLLPFSCFIFFTSLYCRILFRAEFYSCVD